MCYQPVILVTAACTRALHSTGRHHQRQQLPHCLQHHCMLCQSPLTIVRPKPGLVHDSSGARAQQQPANSRGIVSVGSALKQRCWLCMHNRCHRTLLGRYVDRLAYKHMPTSTSLHRNGTYLRLPSAALHLLAYQPGTSNGSKLTAAKFGQCLVDQLLPQSTEAKASLDIDLLVSTSKAVTADRPAIVLSVSGSDIKQHSVLDNYNVNRSLPFEHATDCPCRRAVTLNLQPSPSTAAKPIKVASVVIPYHAASQRYLITRRTETLSVFPRAWVFAGGVVDEQESPLQAGIRELHEECSLTVSESNLQPLCIWESAYPTEDMTPEYPRAHHCIVYYIATINDDNKQPPPTDCNPSEVDCALWLSAEQLQMLSEQNGPTDEQWQTTAADKHISSSEVCGSYPNKHGSGVGKGHLFAIRTLLTQHRQQHATDKR